MRYAHLLGGCLAAVMLLASVLAQADPLVPKGGYTTFGNPSPPTTCRLVTVDSQVIANPPRFVPSVTLGCGCCTTYLPEVYMPGQVVGESKTTRRVCGPVWNHN